MTKLAIDWGRLYHEYKPELIHLTVLYYEEQRNKDKRDFTPPEGTPRYAVDRKRYDNAFWEELVWACVKCGESPDTVYDCINLMTDGLGPWPEFLLRTAESLCCDECVDGWEYTGFRELNFHPLPVVDENELQKKLSEIEKLDSESFSSFSPAAKLCVYLSRPQYWDSLCCDREYRLIFGQVLYRTMNKRNRDVFERVIQTRICEFVNTKFPSRVI